MSGRAAAPGLGAAVKMAASYGPALTSATNCFFASSSSTLWNAQKTTSAIACVDSAISGFSEHRAGACSLGQPAPCWRQAGAPSKCPVRAAAAA